MNNHECRKLIEFKKCKSIKKTDKEDIISFVLFTNTQTQALTHKITVFVRTYQTCSSDT